MKLTKFMFQLLTLFSVLLQLLLEPRDSLKWRIVHDAGWNSVKFALLDFTAKNRLNAVPLCCCVSVDVNFSLRTELTRKKDCSFFSVFFCVLLFR